MQRRAENKTTTKRQRMAFLFYTYCCRICFLFAYFKYVRFDVKKKNEVESIIRVKELHFPVFFRHFSAFLCRHLTQVDNIFFSTISLN